MKNRWVSATLSKVPIQSIGTSDSVALTYQHIIPKLNSKLAMSSILTFLQISSMNKQVFQVVSEMQINVEIPKTTLSLCIYTFNISVNVSELKP